MTSLDLNDHTPEPAPPLSITSPASVAHTAIAEPVTPPAAVKDGEGPRFKDQVCPAVIHIKPVLSDATEDRTTIPLASALFVPDSHIRLEERAQLELERRQLQQQRQNIELDRQRLEDLERQQQVANQQQQQQKGGGCVSKKQWIGGIIVVVVMFVAGVAAVAGVCGSGGCRGSLSQPLASNQPAQPDLVSISAPTTSTTSSSSSKIPTAVPLTMSIPPSKLAPTRPTIPDISTNKPVPLPAPTAGTPDPTATTTKTPTRMPKVSRARSIRSYINSITLTGRSLRYPNNSTAEERALLWLIDDDLGTSEANIVLLRQRYALTTLWFQTATGFDSLDWTSGISECDWYAVDCHITGRVTSLDLSYNGIQGRIPDDIGLLTDLVNLNLGVNELKGTIPSSLAFLTNWVNFDLNTNSLTGTIPSTLASLTTLIGLGLYYNDLTGTIPSALASLTALNYLVLSANSFNGTIPSALGSLTDLTVLLLHNNSLTGTIPSSLGSLTSLAQMWFFQQFLDWDHAILQFQSIFC